MKKLKLLFAMICLASASLYAQTHIVKVVTTSNQVYCYIDNIDYGQGSLKPVYTLTNAWMYVIYNNAKIFENVPYTSIINGTTGVAFTDSSSFKTYFRPFFAAASDTTGGGGSGTVTNVSGVNTNGFTWSIANSTTTPALTLALQNATTSQNGQLTSTDWNTFNGKQAALGFTAENVTNKETTLTNSTTAYPTGSAVTTAISANVSIFNKDFIGLGTHTSQIRLAKDSISAISGSQNVTTSNLLFSGLFGKYPYLAPTLSPKTANFTATADSTYYINLSGGAFTMSLPNNPPDRTVESVFIQTQSGTSALTISGNGSAFNVAGGPTTATAKYLGEYVEWQYDLLNNIWIEKHHKLTLSTFNGLYTSIPTWLTAATTNYTAILTDAGQFKPINDASANTYTIPPHSSVAFPVNTILYVNQSGAGQTTITAGAGVTINTPNSALKLHYQNSTCALIQTSTIDTWTLMGDVAP